MIYKHFQAITAILSSAVALLMMVGCSDTSSEDMTDSQQGFYSVGRYSAALNTDFGSLNFTAYFPVELFDTTNVIHVSRGGTGQGDDRDALMPYTERFVGLGYIVVQVDHRSANDAIEIAQFRGEEIEAIASAIANGSLNVAGFGGSIDGANQGFLGHSAGAMEGLMVTGTQMNHGNYQVPEVTAAYLMSPAGNMPDQFGILPNGYIGISNSAIFIAFGEQEKDINGVGQFMANDWRLQPYQGMNSAGPRFEAFIKGPNTTHGDVPLANPDLRDYNLDNATSFFNHYLRGAGAVNEIGQQSLPPVNGVALQRKGI